ncbi:MAG: hypothetical protein JXR23_01555 [Pontiellaceae bacterium]|nr:hypothetical protein [Pontiellaceae bacterium]
MNDMIFSSDYQDWLKTFKNRIQAAQQRAVLAVNQELLQLYWQIGSDILLRQQEQGWGAKVIDRLAQDLRSAFPDLKGFSRANLLYMRSFAENWPDFHSDPIVQQAVGQIPWGHNLVLISKLKTHEERLGDNSPALNASSKPCWMTPSWRVSNEEIPPEPRRRPPLQKQTLHHRRRMPRAFV